VRKQIGFRCEEELKEVLEIESRDIKNGFGAVIIPRPSVAYRRFIENDFDTERLGQLFINLGNELMKEKNNITNIELRSRFIERNDNKGKQFDVVFEYDVVKKEGKEEWKIINN
jgi:hypothetical protein